MKKIEAIIFDLGNVIIDVQFNKCFASWASALNISANDVQSRYLFDEAYEKHERDEISFSEYHEYIVNNFNLNLSFSDFETGWNCIFGHEISETINFIEQTSLPLYLLSNSNIAHRSIWSKRYASTLNRFKRLYCSSLLKARKPEARSYRLVLKENNLVAENVVFLDDRQDNLEGASAVGLQTILFRDAAEAIEKLHELTKA